MTPKDRMVLRYLPDDPVFTLLDVNESYCRFFGVSRAQVVNSSVVDLVAECSRLGVLAKLRRVINEQIPLLSHEYDYAEGKLARIRWLDIPVMDCGGSGVVVEMMAIGEPLDE
jgi:PAS domain S-box-containing protein